MAHDGKYINKYTGDCESTFVPDAFLEIRKKFGMDDVKKKTDDDSRLSKQKKDFMGKYVCKVCGSTLEWVEGSNIMICTNKSCKGIEKKNKDGSVSSLPVVVYLNSHGEEIAETILD